MELQVRGGIGRESFNHLKSKAAATINSNNNVEFKRFSHLPVILKVYIAKKYYKDIYIKIFEAIKEILADDEAIQKITKLAFEKIDVDGSGFLEMKELETIMLRISADMGVEPPKQQDIEEVFNLLKPYIGIAEKEEKCEFGITAVDSTGYLYTSWYDYSNPNIDVNLNYNDDLPYEHISNIIKREGKPDLMLFYGEPGTGKSSLIKHLICEYPQKEFVFLDGGILANVQQDKLMGYFLDNQNTIFILEDCEKALMNREHNYNPIMPILLNITDGIIGDVLGIKLICTFNTNLSKAILSYIIFPDIEPSRSTTVSHSLVSSNVFEEILL